MVKPAGHQTPQEWQETLRKARRNWLRRLHARHDLITTAEQTGRPQDLNAPAVRNQALEEAESLFSIKALPGAAGALLIAWFLWTGWCLL